MKNTDSRLPAALAAAVAAMTLMPPAARATILSFDLRTPANNTPMPQDYGDGVTAFSTTAADGRTEFLFEEGGGWTPGITVSYGSERPGESPVFFRDAEWDGAARLWSPSFAADRPIGDPAADSMPAGFEYLITFTPEPDANRGVVVNSFVLDDKAGAFDTIDHQVRWRLARGSAAGPVLASGALTVSGGANRFVQTGLAGAEPTTGPVVLVIQRLAGIADDLAIDAIDFDEIGFVTKSYNSGSLGPAADGLNAPGVVLNRPGAIRAGHDCGTSYGAGQNTTIPFLEALNPPADQPFTIEFWALPTATDNDDAPVYNRVSDGDRSGWVFFQRDEATGWNFRMYDGVGSNVGWDLTGGRYTLGTWCHVAALWTGSAARLYVNGRLVDTTNASTRSGNYTASTSATFSIGAYENGGSPFNGLVDEIAFYPTALTAATLLAHFQAAAGTTPGAYAARVAADGARLHLRQNPPSLDLTFPDGIPTVTFTGTLESSESLLSWTPLPVASPYAVAGPDRTASRFFRVRR